MAQDITDPESMSPSLRQCLDAAQDSVAITVAMCVDAMNGLRAVLHCECIEEARVVAMSALIRAGHHSMPSDELASRLRVPQAAVDAALLSYHDGIV